MGIRRSKPRRFGVCAGIHRFPLLGTFNDSLGQRYFRSMADYGAGAFDSQAGKKISIVTLSTILRAVRFS